MNQYRTWCVADDDSSDWTRPGAYLVDPGVYRIPLPLPNDGLRAVNVYAIEDGDGLVLIDSGWATRDARDRLSAALAALGYSFRDVRQFLITHIHRDHYTQAAALRREFGGRVTLGWEERHTVRSISRPGHRPLSPQIAVLRRCGAHPVAKRLIAEHQREQLDLSVWQPPDDWVVGQVDIDLQTRSLQAVPTPGHTRGHLVFRDQRQGLLFAGDHVLPHITPSIGFEPAPAQLPLRNYLRSLRAVRALPDARLLPAHGPVAPSVHARIDELLDHHNQRLCETMTAITQGATTAYETARLLTWTRRRRPLDDLDAFNQMLAITETAAHLDLLVVQGRLQRSNDHETIQYAVAPDRQAGVDALRRISQEERSSPDGSNCRKC